MSLEEVRARAGTFNWGQLSGLEAEADWQLADVLARFPRSAWPEMPKERYAVGLDTDEPTYCRLMEFIATGLGSIKGGAATKLLLYKHRSRDGWFYDASTYDDVDSAWRAIRAAFMRSFELAEAGRFQEIDTLPELSGGPALTLKSLFIYFPDRFMPIYSRAHLRELLQAFGRSEGRDPSLGAVALNRALLDAVDSSGAFEGRSRKAVMEFLYRAFRPSDYRPALVKVSPGPDGQHWDRCLQDEVICIGWDSIGDLRNFESKDDFEAAFSEHFKTLYTRQNKRTEKAREVWRFRELREGDQVVANRGTSQVLAVGTVTEREYEFDPTRPPEQQHVVHVQWDVSKARELAEPIKRWALVTVSEVRTERRTEILGESASGGTSSTPPLEVSPLLRDIEAALDRRGQVILCGPPGTGKTFHARRFAEWWLGGASEAASQGRYKLVTLHPSYAYEDWIEGFRPVDHGDGVLQLELQSGVFQRMCQAASDDPDKRYLIVVDELNRGNVAKIFGECITLLEKDKRGVVVDLPQSQRSFAVPANVHIIGTMNTADRSIALLDVALRRRFGFVEVGPEPGLLEEAVGPIDLVQLLTNLNERVAEVVGPEKQIGHSYFMPRGTPVSDPDELAAIMRFEVVPLIEEYCFDDPTSVARILGSDLVDGTRGVRHAVVTDTDALLASLRSLAGADASA